MSKGVNNLLFNCFYIIFILFCYYNAQFWITAIIYETETSTLLLNVLLLLLEIICFTIIIVNKRLIRLRGIHLICLLWFLLMPIILIYNDSPSIFFFKCTLWPLLFEATYLLTLHIKGIDKSIYKCYRIIGFIGLYIFFTSMIFMSFGGASNMIYFVLLTGPFLLLTNQKKVLYIILVGITILAILSSKRSMVLAIFLFWTIFGGINAVRNKRIISTFFVGILLAICAVYAFQKIENLTGGSMSSRMESEDITNGREILFLETYFLFTESSVDHKILGNGHNAVKRDNFYEKSAHNEWMEILYDYGIIIFFLYLCLWIYMIRKWIYLYKNKSEYLWSYTLCLCLWSIMSITSQLILYVSYVLYLFMFLAFVEAKTKSKFINCVE